MINRIKIGELSKHIGEEVIIAGWVDVRRDHGKLIFIDLRDVSGKVQMVVLPAQAEAIEVAQKLRAEWVIRVTGLVNARPEKMVKADQLNGELEVEVKAIEILSEAKELPFDKDGELNLDTYLDYLPLTLRTKRTSDIFKVQATILEAYRESLRQQGFIEFESPALVGGDAEGGSAVFSVDYYYDQKAFLATSPQFYKQIMVGAFERPFTIAKVFRAEKSATTRHISEITQMDFEMGFIKNHLDPMAVLEQAIKDSVNAVADRHAEVFKEFNTEKPLIPEKFPILTLLEAQEILEKEFGTKAVGEPDMEPEHERQICEWAKREKGSDFVFITHFPTSKRAFYTYADPTNPKLSLSFDLIFRGLEINSGSQRIHNYEELVEKIKSRGMDPEKFKFYLQTFKYGMPPHGGSSTGLERFTARLLELANIKEATSFPRDMNRIDNLLSTDK
ncbi:MAG: aspartate--tRNA(Asn) ligase [Candidatus Paceibacterota bacterium]|jgi:nondiscriminating aspartyl-tRNA synthetase